MILCVGLAADDTFRHTIAAITRRGFNADVIDIAQLAHSGTISASLNELGATTIELHGKRYRLDHYDAAFVRLHDISPVAPTESLAARSAAIFRTLCRIFTHAPIPVINPPLRDRSNFTKLLHAAELASIAGWRTPRSCLANDAATVRAFVTSCADGVIFKGSSGAKTWANRYDHLQHDSRLDLLWSCPVLFQEYIKGPDVRAHAVGDQLFAEMIISTSLDYRTTRGNVYRTVETVPGEIRAGASALQRQTNLPFLGIDFKIDDATGEWLFLEANPMPGYEGYDRRAGGAISDAIVTWLCCRSVPCRPSES
jgi:glutathione synthase/RimK-type ligase-like ATP-grasp enzyme